MREKGVEIVYDTGTFLYLWFLEVHRKTNYLMNYHEEPLITYERNTKSSTMLFIT